jgi:hypothetical protein
MDQKIGTTREVLLGGIRVISLASRITNSGDAPGENQWSGNQSRGGRKHAHISAILILVQA